MNNNKLKNKLIFCSYDIWKRIYLSYQNIVFKNQKKIIYHRSSTIPKIFINYPISIYNGKKLIKRNVNRWMIGFKVGEFTWNKKVALYKAKQLKKKKAKQKTKI